MSEPDRPGRADSWTERSAGDSRLIEAISDHIELHIGPVAEVLYELDSPNIHVDLHIVDPSEEYPFYTLVTSEMAERSMNAPKSAHDWRFAELLIHLPENWPIHSMDALHDERYAWPIWLIKSIARYPHDHNTWIGPGHTIQKEGSEEPYATNVGFTVAMLLYPELLPQEFTTIDMGNGEKIWLYNVIPLYPEELNYKIQHGNGFDERAGGLYDRITNLDTGVTPEDLFVITRNRRNVITYR